MIQIMLTINAHNNNKNNTHLTQKYKEMQQNDADNYCIPTHDEKNLTKEELIKFFGHIQDKRIHSYVIRIVLGILLHHPTPCVAYLFEKYLKHYEEILKDKNVGKDKNIILTKFRIPRDIYEIEDEKKYLQSLIISKQF